MKGLKLKNKKGFTLIELLAVIVILGILMMVAIPAVTRVIANSRRDAYIDNAKKIVEAVRTEFAAGNIINASSEDCPYPPVGTITRVTLSDADIKVLLERGGEKSSFNRNYNTAYVFIQNNGGSSTDVGSYTYYISIVDKGNNGISYPVAENLLKRSDVVVGKSEAAKSDVYTTDASGTKNKVAATGACTYNR